MKVVDEEVLASINIALRTAGAAMAAHRLECDVCSRHYDEVKDCYAMVGDILADES